jgi:hypothetical protein
MTKQFQIKFLVFLVLLFVFIFPFLIVSAATTTGPNLEYAPMETLPGFVKTADFPTFISNLYKFGIWTVGICALIMIVIGGYMYAASGGNNASMEKAKTFITDALVGLVLALLAYLILYIINPKLVEINMGTTGAAGTTDKISTLADCTGTNGVAPANSDLCSTDVPLKSTAVRVLAACEAPPQPCTYKCKDNYTLKDGKCITIVIPSTSLQKAATDLSANTNVKLAGSGDCKDASGTAVSPNSNIIQTTKNEASTVCNATCKSGTSCTGSIFMSIKLLDAINTVGKSTPLTVSSLTGGQHTSSGSTHYSGKGADITTGTKSEWSSVIKKFQDVGCTAFCDLNGNEDKTCTIGNHVHVSC